MDYIQADLASLISIQASPSSSESRFRLPSSALISRLNACQLDTEDISRGKFSIRVPATSKIISILGSTQAIEKCQPLLKELSTWPKKIEWPDFIDKINQVIVAWLGAYKADTSINTALFFTQFIQLRRHFFTDNSKKFRLFLLGLLAEAATNYDQYKYEYMESRDAVNGLPNARQMRRHIQETIDRRASHHEIGLLLIHIKVAFSISASDQSLDPRLVTEIVRLIQQNLRHNDSLFYIGPTEFSIVLSNFDNAVKLELLAAKLERTFEEVLHVDRKPYSLTPTIAGTRLPVSEASPELIYSQARLTLDDALHTGKHVAMFRPEINERAIARVRLEEQLIEAFKDNQLTLCLQPIMDLPGEICTGAEVLLRIRLNSGQSVSPVEVIETIYKHGLGRRFTRWLLSSVCRLSSEIHDELGQHIRLTVNLSAEDLHDPELPHLLSQNLMLWSVKPEDIVLEITENELLVDEEAAYKIMGQLVQLGCKLALDDFGTGYSSMSRLRSMPIHLVKIDQSFVRNIANSAEDAEIVRAIALLAHGLGKEVIAEGVEDKDCLDLIKEMKCQKIQGYYYAKPLPHQEFCAWIKARNASPEKLSA